MSQKLKAKNSVIHDQGLFAIELIYEGEVILDWGVNLLTGDEAVRSGLPSMQWDEDAFSVDDGRLFDAYCVNHSCEPNIWMVEGLRLAARRDIQIGEEITADYALWSADSGYVSTWTCRCGCVGCRGNVTGNDWRRSDIQEKYRGHFSPLINKGIVRAVI